MSFSCDFQFSSVTQSCLTFCDPMYSSTPGFPVHYQLLKLVQTYVYKVSDVIQPPHPLSSPSPLAFSLSQPLGSFPMSWFLSGGQTFGASASASVLPMKYSGLMSFMIDWFDLLAVQGTLSALQHHSSKTSILWHS